MNYYNFFKRLIILLTLIFLSFRANAQVTIDEDYNPVLEKKAYLNGSGLLVCIDNAHGNYHTLEGSFSPFGKLLRADGYNVISYEEAFQEDKLKKCRILVIANPLHPSDKGEWVLPNPSAFKTTEISVLKRWVEQGGRLLLIADHMPFAGAAHDLGKSFGYDFINGFEQKDGNHWPPAVFSIQDQTLVESEITNGIQASDNINSVATFTGSAFKAPKEAKQILLFPKEYYALTPDTAWRFNQNTPKTSLEGYSQGAFQEVGKGKIVVLGEAGMVTAQVVNNFKMGLSSPRAPENEQFALNVIHWLDEVESYVSIKELITNLNKQLENDFNEGRYSKLADYYTENARVIGPYNQVVEGKEAIFNYWKSLEIFGRSWRKLGT